MVLDINARYKIPDTLAILERCLQYMSLKVQNIM